MNPTPSARSVKKRGKKYQYADAWVLDSALVEIHWVKDRAVEVKVGGQSFYPKKPTRSLNEKLERKFRAAWNHINWRCRKNPLYTDRGIRNEWASFEQFRKDMWRSFLRHHAKYGGKFTTIDRRDNDGNYSKQNCRWATPKTQNNNQRWPKKKWRVRLKCAKRDCEKLSHAKRLCVKHYDRRRYEARLSEAERRGMTEK